ncbi:MAG: hypothetical protein J6S85_10360 [Methanobrevibacter sp.]|nr:hypothetical protein [Methanobrevibacter sp.]
MELSVNYILNPDQVAQLERITELYNNISRADGQNDIAPERLFENIMFLGSTPEISKKLDFFEKNCKNCKL